MVILNNTHGYVSQNYHYSKHLQVNTTSTRQLPGLGEDMVKRSSLCIMLDKIVEVVSSRFDNRPWTKEGHNKSNVRDTPDLTYVL